VAALRKVAQQHQLYIPFAEFVAAVILHEVESATERLPSRWMSPRNGLSFGNIGFHLAQLEAAILVGNLEVVDDLSRLFDQAYQSGCRAAIELGDDSADMWVERAEESATSAGSVLEMAMVDLHRSRQAFSRGRGGQADLDRGRSALETLDVLGAPLLARLQRERLTALVGQRGMPSGRERTVMFTDIVDSTRLMSSAGNAAWAMVLGEHHRLVRTVVGRFRGSIMTATGDGFSAWFEQPGDAVEAAHALHQAIDHAALVVPGGALTVRVGLASGSVFDLGADVSGMAVAEAARVMATAGPRETHASQSLVDHGLEVSTLRSLGVHTLRGLPNPVEIYALVPINAV
jgi:class 3 adenylate cyclase